MTRDTQREREWCAQIAEACALGVSEGLTLEECFRLLNAPTPELEASLRAWAGVGA